MRHSSIFKKCALTLISVIIILNGNAQDAEQAISKMLPEIPAEITDPAKRAEYLTQHFWDKYDFSDAAFLEKDEMLERSFVDFVDLLSLVPEEARDKSINLLMKKAESEPKVFADLITLSEQYLYALTSPLCDEEKLIPFLQYALQAPVFSDVEKIRPAFVLECITKNRLGDTANDIVYTLKTGDTGTLHSINAEHTLLYFNDPECEDCKFLIKQLIASTKINDLISNNKLKIITVYLFDNIETWEKHSSEVPDTWIYSRDAEQKIMIENDYNIKQFPTIYLLGKEKKVILKETTFEKLEDYFRE